MQTNLIILGRAFLHKRLDLKLEIKDVAEKSGLSTLTVSKLEKGQLNNTSVETWKKWPGPWHGIDHKRFVNSEHMEKNWGNKKRVLPRPLYEYKDVPFLDEEAAEVAYLHAVDLANNLFLWKESYW
jgi:hypothetical protein